MLKNILRACYFAGISIASISANAHTQAVTPPNLPVQMIDEDGQHLIRLNGEVMHIGGGTIESWVLVSSLGYSKIGLTLSSKALDASSLPTASEGHHFDAHISFPKLALLPFNHSYIAWKPSGHGPSGMYNAPHYDFHFAFVSPEFMEAITVEGSSGQQVPPAGYMPEMWEPQLTTDGSYASVAGQGVHWHYKNAPEWNGGIFTETFMWGSYAGKNIFMEPMITLATLTNTNSFERPIELPACVTKSGFYPRIYGWQQRITPSGERFLDLYLKDFIFKKVMSIKQCGKLSGLH